MEQLDLNLHFQIYDSPDELQQSDKDLLQAANQAIKDAYAPYSAYKVGSAVLLENGEIIIGNNQENVAYPSGLCAERVALFYASANFPEVAVKAVAITASAVDFDINEPVTPCGSCRQVMAETEHRHENSIRVIMQGETGKVLVSDGINNLLPLMFHAEELKK